MTRDLWLLAGVWIAWGALHSLLIMRPVQRLLEERLGGAYRYTRLAYNLLALITFLAAWGYARALDGPPVFTWWGAWRPVSAVLLVAAAGFLWAGSRAYDTRTFLGLRQLGHGEHAHGLAADGGISRRGVLGMVRHPWYTAAYCALWAGPKSEADIVTAGTLSLYVAVGTLLEEAKLRREFGEAYRAYQRDVSMVLPWKWFGRRLGILNDR